MVHTNLSIIDTNLVSRFIDLLVASFEEDNTEQKIPKLLWGFDSHIIMNEELRQMSHSFFDAVEASNFYVARNILDSIGKDVPDLATELIICLSWTQIEGLAYNSY